MHLALALPFAARFQRFFAPNAAAARPAQHVIGKRGIHCEPAPFGVTVQCLAGCLWLTQDGDARDVVIEAGQSHTCDRVARLMVQGLEASTFTTRRA